MGDPLAANKESNYLFDSIVLEGYNLVPIGYVNDDYPTSFVIGNNDNGDGYAYDMEQLFHKLRDCGIACEFFYDKYENGTEPGHGYLSDLKNDKLAVKCYRAMVKFLKKD